MKSALAFAALLCTVTTPCHAVLNFSSSATAGYYRDVQERSHTPLFYNFSYNGLHQNGWESAFELTLSNDFSVNEWKALPALATVVVPIHDGWEGAQHRKSRIQLGRQLLTETFDFLLLDGIQSPIYWSPRGGFSLYGGSSRSMDYAEDDLAPLAGVSLFEEFFGVRLRAGWSGRHTDLKQTAATGALATTFEDLPLSPTISSRAEWSLDPQDFSQSASELTLNPNDRLAMSLMHSWRTPHKVTKEDNLFLYRLLSRSAQETQQLLFSWELTQTISAELMGRANRYNSGYRFDNGDQQQVTLHWQPDSRQVISPTWGRLYGFGGEYWDGGIEWKRSLSETTIFESEASAAWINKINGIHGWAYHFRSGINYQLASRWTAFAWLELERNHLFDMDARVIANVTFIQ